MSYVTQTFDNIWKGLGKEFHENLGCQEVLSVSD